MCSSKKKKRAKLSLLLKKQCERVCKKIQGMGNQMDEVSQRKYKRMFKGLFMNIPFKVFPGEKENKKK